MAAGPGDAAMAAGTVRAAGEPPPGADGAAAAAGPIAAALATLAAVWDDGAVVEVSLRRLATGAALMALVLAVMAAVRRFGKRAPVDQRAAFFALFEARIRNEFPAQVSIPTNQSCTNLSNLTHNSPKYLK